MSIVGIIANPASGRDIRRLVAHASVFDNNEKVNILQRAFLAMDAIGVEQVLIMPDYYALGERALDGLKLSSLRIGMLDTPMTSSEDDSTVAATRFNELNAGAIIVLGGDGTNRVVAKGSGDVPIVSISTGTNNVFSTMVEGTVAGMAAALVANGVVAADQVSYRAKRLELSIDGQFQDIALIDVVTTTDLWVGTRAIWDPGRIQEVVLARAEPGSIGLSSLGSCFRTCGAQDKEGMYLAMGANGTRVLAPLGPGLLTSVNVREHRLVRLGEEVRLAENAGTIALDGERSIELYHRPEITVRLTNCGPRVVDIRQCLREAANMGFFCEATQCR